MKLKMGGAKVNKAGKDKQAERAGARKLSNVSHRNIQLLSMRTRSERETFADQLKGRRRSSLINLILGAPSSGPRFSDDLCSISSRLTNFGIEFFPECANNNNSNNPRAGSSRASTLNSLRFGGSTDSATPGASNDKPAPERSTTRVELAHSDNKQPEFAKHRQAKQKQQSDSANKQEQQCAQRAHRRRSSEGSLAASVAAVAMLQRRRDADAEAEDEDDNDAAKQMARQHDSENYNAGRQSSSARPRVEAFRDSAMASIDLTSSFEKHLAPPHDFARFNNYPLAPQRLVDLRNQAAGKCSKARQDFVLASSNNSKRRLNPSSRFLRRSGSELSLYSNGSAAANSSQSNGASGKAGGALSAALRKSTAKLQVFAPNFCWRNRQTDSLEYCDSNDGDHDLGGEVRRNNTSKARVQDSPSKPSLGSPASSSTSLSASENDSDNLSGNKQQDPMRETKLLIILQVCLPFIFAGFGNMGAGLVLSRIANWEVARHVSTFLVVLPPLVGLKGNIEMTLASRLSTLANLNLLDSAHRRRRAFVSNLVLILSQAIGLSLFASMMAILCELAMSAYSGSVGSFGHQHHFAPVDRIANQQSILHNHAFSSPLARAQPTFNDTSTETNWKSSTIASNLLAKSEWPLLNGSINSSTGERVTQAAYAAQNNDTLKQHPRLQQSTEQQPLEQFNLTLSVQVLLLIASALTTSLVVVCLSSLMMSLAIVLARLIMVNPDNLSTLIAALYGDVSFVLIYGLVASYMFKLISGLGLLWPGMIIGSTLSIWPLLLFGAYKFKETHEIALSSLPPMLVSILISLGSGAVLSIVVKRFSLLALYQPIVNGFSANLVAVQASRVSTWLWCSALKSTINDDGAAEHGAKCTVTGIQSEVAPALDKPPEHLSVERKKNDLGSLASFAPEPEGQLNTVITAPSGDKTSFASSSDIIGLSRDDCAEKKEQNSIRIDNVTRKLINIFDMIKHLLLRRLFWSFTNDSPNSVAAKLLLMMLIPAHTLYFLVIWLLFSSSPSTAGLDSMSATTIHLTWSFYLVYLTVCIIQISILFLLCEPFMTLLMKQGYDPDIIGISILMALADLTGTLFLTGAFYTLAALGDINASH